jgi:hypothetical protein
MIIIRLKMLGRHAIVIRRPAQPNLSKKSRFDSQECARGALSQGSDGRAPQAIAPRRPSAVRWSADGIDAWG